MLSWAPLSSPCMRRSRRVGPGPPAAAPVRGGAVSAVAGRGREVHLIPSCGEIGGVSVSLSKDSLRAADLVAEELGHALGRPHAGCKVHSSLESEPCEPTIQQFPCAHGGICTPGFDTVALRVS